MRTPAAPASAEPGRTPFPLRGRDPFVARVVEAVRAGPGAVLGGPRGGGRTAVLEAVRDRLVAAGDRVVEIRPAASGARPFAALVPALGTDLPATVDAGSLGVVGDALARCGGGESVLVLLVDGLDDLDDPVAAVVHQVVATGSARLVASVTVGRTDASLASTPWWWDVAERIDLAALDRADAHLVAEDLLGGPLDARSREWVWAAAQGHPAGIVAVVDATVADGAWERRSGLWALAEDEARGADGDLLARLEVLEPEVRTVVEALALVGPLVIDDAEALGTGALVAAEREGLVRTDEGSDGLLWCAVASRIVAAALRASLDPAHETERWGRVVRVLDASGDPSRLTTVARGRALVGAGRAGPGARPQDLDAVLTAAVAAQTLSRWEESVALAGPVWRARPDTDALTCLTVALGMLGDHQAIRALSDQLDRADEVAAGSAHHAATIAISQFHSGDAAGAFATADRTRRSGPVGTRPFLDVFESRLRSFVGDQDAARALAERWCTASDPELRIEAMTVRASVAAVCGDVAEAISGFDEAFALAIALPDVPAALAGTPYLFGLSAYADAGRLVEAVNGAEAVWDETVRSGDATGRGWLALHLGRCHLLAGRPRDAAHMFAQAVNDFRPLHRPGWVGYPAAGLVAAHAAAGDLVAATTARAEWAEISDHAVALFRGEELRLVAWLDAAEGHHEAAVSGLAEAADRAVTVGSIPYEVSALHDLARIDAGEGRMRAADGLVRLAAVAANPLIDAHAAQARALLSDASEDLVPVAAEYEAMGYLLDARETWAELGRRTEDEREQALARRRGAALAGATPGLTTPMLGVTVAQLVLTRREREIAELVAGGASRHQVADRLVVSVRTIDSHLQRIYRKLGVRGRRDLAEVLAEVGPGA